jgi:hypothetical protein
MAIDSAEIVSKRRRSRKIDNPRVAVYPCGDIYFSKDAVERWNLPRFAGADILCDRQRATIWLLLKHAYDNGEHRKLMADKRPGHTMSISIISILEELRRKKPDEAMDVDAEFISENNILKIDLYHVPRAD